jgi:hypothetical protein
VWETLSRDLKAVWEKMRQVLWPKYLLGGMLVRSEGGVEGGEGVRGMGGFGRWPDADDVLGGSMSEGLRDWDLWCVDSLSESDLLVAVVRAGISQRSQVYVGEAG